MPHIESDPNTMLELDQAHKAYEKVQLEIETAVAAANRRINEEFTPILYTAKSVLYEAMGKAAQAGFTLTQMYEVMDCDSH